MCGGRKDWEAGPGPRALYTPKAGLGSNSWAEQWRPRGPCRLRQPCRPAPSGPRGCVTLQPRPSQPLWASDPRVPPSAFSPGPSVPPWHTLTSPQAGEAVSRGRRLGAGLAASGRPPGLTQERKSQGGKNSSLSPPTLPPDPSPHGDLEVTSLLAPTPPAQLDRL